MKPNKILRTIECHLGLKPIKMPKIKEDPKYLEGMGSGAVIIDETGITISVKDKKDLEVIAEELTHIADIRSGTPIEPLEYVSCFYDNVLIEALGYYGSKLITPERKPIQIREPELKKDIEEKNWGKLIGFYTTQPGLQKNIRLWHQIGYDLGEKVYNYVKATGNKEPAISLLIKNRNKEKPFEVYKKILEEVTR
ncbi:MAG: hypothetical protein Q8N77_02065 [Nanoarchaeota archaeon]|nr:hypothetical protein [Nanoarchaeota archaeon]